VALAEPVVEAPAAGKESAVVPPEEGSPKPDTPSTSPPVNPAADVPEQFANLKVCSWACPSRHHSWT